MVSRLEGNCLAEAGGVGMISGKLGSVTRFRHVEVKCSGWCRPLLACCHLQPTPLQLTCARQVALRPPVLAPHSTASTWAQLPACRAGRAERQLVPRPRQHHRWHPSLPQSPSGSLVEPPQGSPGQAVSHHALSLGRRADPLLRVVFPLINTFTLVFLEFSIFQRCMVASCSPR